MSEQSGHLLFIIAAVLSLVLGLFIYLRPMQTFEIQKQFYAMINWRIEPISLQKEIRNTKIMGLFLLIFVLMAAVYAWRR